MYPVQGKIPVRMTIQMLKDFIRENYNKDADVIVENGKVYIKIPLNALWDYRMDGDAIIVELGG